MRVPTDDIPGNDLVEAGLAALERGDWSVEALLVTVGAERLKAVGMHVPHPPDSPAHPELALYRALGQAYPDDTHSRYNALIRRLVSFEREMERRHWTADAATRDACPAGSTS